MCGIPKTCGRDSRRSFLQMRRAAYGLRLIWECFRKKQGYFERANDRRFCWSTAETDAAATRASD